MYKNPIFLFIIIVFTAISFVNAQNEWHKNYAQGKKALSMGKYEIAINKFQEALKESNTDIERVRTYGMHFIQYFPNREIGIAYYHLGDKNKAAHFLNISKKMEPSKRAHQYLDKLEGVAIKDFEKDEKENPGNDKLIVGQKTVKLVGERMSIAVFPFENKGASEDLGEIVLDKMITALFNEQRFRVIERSQLNRIIEEQQLGLSGIIDASTAAALGKGLGVDAIILGSVAATRSGSISIDARAIDTESATIIVAHDSYSGNADALSVKTAVENLANKIAQSIPLVEGSVIQVNQDNTILLDGGRHAGLRKGLKCIIYKEGPELKHPISGEVLGRKTIIIGEVLVTESLDKFATAKLIDTTKGQSMSMGDKFLTK